MKQALTRVFALFMVLVSARATAQPLTGIKNIPGDYPALLNAFQWLNSQGVGAGGVTLNVLTGNPQTAPAGGYIIGNAAGLLNSAAAMRQVIIQGNGNTITASASQTAGSTEDAVFKIIEADWITITNCVIRENPANVITEVTTNRMTEFGIGQFYFSATNGSQNKSFINNDISLERTYRNSFGIFSTAQSPLGNLGGAIGASTAAGSHSNTKVYGNSIRWI